MKRRLLVLVALTLGATFAVTALSSGAAAGSAPVVRSHTAGLTKAVRLPAVATKETRAVAKRAISAVRHLQASAGGTGVVCIGGSSNGSTLSNQTCTIKSNSGVCIEVTNDPSATQLCDFTQQSVGKTNLAVALQVILQRGGGGGTQSGTQTTSVNQMNANKPNLSFVTQILKQSLGTGSDNPDNEVANQAVVEQKGELASALPNFAPLVDSLQSIESAQEGEEVVTSDALGSPISQTQQSQQTVNVCQGGPTDCHSSVGMTSTNLSSVYQSLRQRERAGNSTAIEQSQNPQDGTCPTSIGGTRNMCAIVDQNATGTGKNASGLVELYRQFQSGFKATSLTQVQDPSPFGPFASNHGLDHDVQQTVEGADPLGPKRNTIATIQVARQIQRARDITNLIQFQDPRSAKGPASFQAGSNADTWFGRQTSRQFQTNNGDFTTPTDFVESGQEQVLTYQGFSPGTFDVIQLGGQNGKSVTQTCTGSGSCQIGIVCTSVPPGEGEPGGCAPFFPGGGDIELSRPR
jgi:hypothetical protein